MILRFLLEGSSPDDYPDKLRQFFCVRYEVAWGSGFHTMFTPNFTGNVSLLVHHFLSFLLTFSDACLLNFQTVH